MTAATSRALHARLNSRVTSKKSCAAERSWDDASCCASRPEWAASYARRILRPRSLHETVVGRPLGRRGSGRERTPIIVAVPKPPSFPSVSRKQQQARAQVLERAAAALRMRRFAEAEQLAAEVLQSEPGRHRRRLDLGAGPDRSEPRTRRRSRRSKGRRAAAATLGIETLLGAALGGAGRREEAIEQLRRTAARRPPFTPAFQELAGQLAKAGRIDEAIAVVESGSCWRPRPSSCNWISRACTFTATNAARRARSFCGPAKPHRGAPKY